MGNVCYEDIRFGRYNNYFCYDEVDDNEYFIAVRIGVLKRRRLCYLLRFKFSWLCTISIVALAILCYLITNNIYFTLSLSMILTVIMPFVVDDLESHLCPYRPVYFRSKYFRDLRWFPEFIERVREFGGNVEIAKMILETACRLGVCERDVEDIFYRCYSTSKNINSLEECVERYVKTLFE